MDKYNSVIVCVFLLVENDSSNEKEKELVIEHTGKKRGNVCILTYSSSSFPLYFLLMLCDHDGAMQGL